MVDSGAAWLTKITSLTSLGAMLFVMILGCSRPESEPRPAAPRPSAPSAAPALSASSSSHDVHAPTPQRLPSHAAAPTAEVMWKVPEGWVTLPARMMRKATYEAPGEKGAAEVGVFYFGPGQGGGVEPNIERWVNQFTDASPAKRSEETINGMKAVTVEIEKGTYQSGMPGGPTTPRAEWALFGSIVETPQGAYFFKMTGPSPTVATQKGQLRAMLATITVQQPTTP